MVFPNDPDTLLSTLLIGHPLKNEKAILWTFIIEAFFWLTWIERNHRIFEDREMTLASYLFFGDYLISIVLYKILWAKKKSKQASY